jgi:hypothetical protein
LDIFDNRLFCGTLNQICIQYDELENESRITSVVLVHAKRNISSFQGVEYVLVITTSIEIKILIVFLK